MSWKSWFPISQSANLASDVTVLYPRRDHIDLFGTTRNGSVTSTWWDPTRGGWQNWFLIHEETKLLPGATVSALAPRENHIDLFATDAAGIVWSTWWNPDRGGWQKWFPIHATTKLKPGATVAALAPRENHIDLFGTDATGVVWSTWWNPGKGGWQPWFPIQAVTKLAPGTTVSALAPRENHIDLFGTDANGVVWSTWWNPNKGGWQPWFPIHPERTMRPGATVTAIASRENHVDLFATDAEGAVWSTWWNPDRGGWQNWFPIHSEKKLHPGTTVSALAPRADHVDLFATDAAGGVWSTWWNPAVVGGWSAWFPIFPATRMRPGAVVVPLLPRKDHVDLFSAGPNDIAWSTWWEPGAPGTASLTLDYTADEDSRGTLLINARGFTANAPVEFTIKDESFISLASRTYTKTTDGVGQVRLEQRFELLLESKATFSVQAVDVISGDKASASITVSV